MNLETANDLFVAELRRAYAIEDRLVDELETLARDAGVDALDDSGEMDLHDRLQTAFSDHQAETETHRDRLEEAFDALDEPVETRSTAALDGLVEEKELFNNVVLADELRPLYYLEIARDVEQLEITGYDRLLRLADHLDVPGEVVDVLEENRAEERAALETIESLAEGEALESLLEAMSPPEKPG